MTLKKKNKQHYTGRSLFYTDVLWGSRRACEWPTRPRPGERVAQNAIGVKYNNILLF